MIYKVSFPVQHSLDWSLSLPARLKKISGKQLKPVTSMNGKTGWPNHYGPSNISVEPIKITERVQ